MMERAAPRDLREVTRREPCPICHHTGWCCIRLTDGAVLCHRTASPFPVKGEGGGHWHNLPQPGEQTERVTWTPADFAAPGEPPVEHVADPDIKHAVYSRLLALCPLSPAHRTHLLGPRQLPEEALTNYGTLPEGKAQAPILAALVAEFGREALLETPGFALDQSRPGGLRLNGAGLLISVRDVGGRIQGMQLRLDRGKTRYIWLSSPDVASSGTPAHVARPAQITDQRVYLTEGPLKADIAAHRLGAIAVGITGVGTWRVALPLLEALQAQGHDVVIVALDADDPAKPGTVTTVEGIRHELAAALVALGFAVRLARWDHSQGKGIDDLLLAGGTYALEAYRPTADGDARPSDSEAQRRLRYLRTVIQAPNMERTQKLLYLNALVKGDLWPWTMLPEAAPPPAPRRLPILTIMKGAGVKSPSSARPYMEALRDDGLLSYSIGLDKKNPDGREVAYFRPGRPLTYEETPSKPAHLEPAKERAEKARKMRCPCCASDRLSPTHLVCDECAAEFTVAAAEKAAAKYTRQEYEAQQQTVESQQPAQPPPTEAPPHLSNFDRGTVEADKEIPLSNFDRTPPTCQTSTGPHRAPPAAQRAPAADPERAGGAASLIAKLQEQATLSDLELEWRWSTTAEAGRYKRLAPEERGRVDAVYHALRARFQGHAPPPPAPAGVWEVA